jgi:heat shock protein HspQ
MHALSDQYFFHPMTANKGREYCLIVEGAYLTEGDAEHALRDPFIEDWVEQTGHFKIHNMNDIQVTAGVTLGSLGVVMLEERVFEIASVDPEHPLTEHKAKGVAEALRRQDMFDEVDVEPREEYAIELPNDEEVS